MRCGMRQPVVAGVFYPGGKEELKESISELLKQSKNVKPPGVLRALVVPHAGYVYSGVVAAAGYKMLKGLDYSRFIIMGPSHFSMFEGASFPPDDYWSTPLGRVKVIKPRETEILRCVPEAHLQEHSIEVQLPFLQTVAKDFAVMPLVLGQVNPAELSKQLLSFMDDKTFIIVSSDLSHYYPYEDAVRIDSVANEAIPSLDIEKAEESEACGIAGILTLLHTAKSLGWKGLLIDYRNSGDTSGNKAQVVGYGCYGFCR
jgi:AmmeMemoRadiSam system protein B